MRVTKLVIGILMIVYSVWLFIQGLLGGFLGIISEKNMVAGIIGVLLCGLFMASGIAYVSTENSDGLGGDIAGFDDCCWNSRNYWWLLCWFNLDRNFSISNWNWILCLAFKNKVRKDRISLNS